MKHNRREIKVLRERAKEWGIEKVSIKTVQVYTENDQNNLVPEEEELSRYKKSSAGKFQLRNELLNRCWKLWSSAVITWDGNVVPCCFDKDASHVMGNVSKTAFSEIWKNNDYRKFRSQLTVGRKEIDICRNCSEGAKVFLDPSVD